MPREAALLEIAGLVARAEQVKRNRETILRTVQPKPRPTPASRSLALSQDGHLGVHLRVDDDADSDAETQLTGT